MPFIFERVECHQLHGYMRVPYHKNLMILTLCQSEILTYLGDCYIQIHLHEALEFVSVVTLK